MNTTKLSDIVKEFFEKVLIQKCRILSIIPKEDQYEVICEVTIDPAYTTIRGLGDIVEIYQVNINSSMEIAGFSLKETKRKAALDQE